MPFYFRPCFCSKILASPLFLNKSCYILFRCLLSHYQLLLQSFIQSSKLTFSTNPIFHKLFWYQPHWIPILPHSNRFLFVVYSSLNFCFSYTWGKQAGYSALLPRDLYTERGYATVCRLSVRPSVCQSVCLSVRDVQVPWSHRLE